VGVSTPDLSIFDATLLDGTGTNASRGDLEVHAGVITRVGTARPAKREIDARGRVLCPGFIDTHAHDDAALLRHPGMEFKLSQGITTVVVGNCGFSAFPSPSVGPMVPGNTSLFAGLEERFSSLDEYRKAVDHVAPAVNCLSLVGHNTVRWQVIGAEERPPTPEELGRMRSLVPRLHSPSR
jgi:N-acyl-D-amino-acid deacylase